MIQRPTNWSEVKEPTDRKQLPADAYVCRIDRVQISTNDYGDQLNVLFDIAEGDYRGFFAEDYKATLREDKKWKGVYRIWLPKNDGSEKDEWSKSSLKGFTTAVERSNPGYAWNWDEQSLCGKLIGILFRNVEWEWDGKTGWAVKPFCAMTADKVRSGEYSVPADKPLKKSAPSTDFGFGFGSSGSTEYDTKEDSGLPF